MARGGCNKHIAIYNLDEKNSEILSSLTACLTKYCSVKYYKKLELKLYDNKSIGCAISTLRKDKGDETNLQRFKIKDEDLDLLTNKDLTTLLYDEHTTRNNSKSYDVVMILGHSNISHVGSFDTANVLEVILKRHNPSIIALLGCCGGGARFGSLLEISQMESKTIFGFYQRRIYPDELVRTGLVLGIRYYFHLKHFLGTSVEERTIIRRSFVCAALEIPLDRDDPSIFANDSDKRMTAQYLLEVFKEKFTPNPIPLACLQVAFFHVFTVGEGGHHGPPTISTFTEKIKLLDVCEIEKESESELQRRRLDEIISLTDEILHLPVLDDTLDKLKDGRWKEVDPLQFMIAMLHGYWGKNSYTDIRCCAHIHHNKLKQNATNAKSEDDIHKYHLGAVALCLFCESTYVNFDLQSPDEKIAFEIKLGPKLSELDVQLIKLDIPRLPCGLMTGAIRVGPPTAEDLPFKFHSFPEQAELIWVDHHHHMKPDNKFIQLFDKNDSFVHIINHHNTTALRYEYKAAQFKNALKKLQTYLRPLLKEIPDKITETDEGPYHVKEFQNKCSVDEGRMKCFKDWSSTYGFIDYKYAEMRISEDCDKHPLISRCRFVYQYRHNDRKSCEGTLYFTDCHYGWDLIKEDDMDRTLKAKCNFQNDRLQNLNYFQKQEKLPKRELYILQVNITDVYPFKAIAGLTVSNNECKLRFKHADIDITKRVEC